MLPWLVLPMNITWAPSIRWPWSGNADYGNWTNGLLNGMTVESFGNVIDTAEHVISGKAIPQKATQTDIDNARRLLYHLRSRT